MRYERSDKAAPRPPHCPGCAQTMRLARITSRFDDLPELYSFECRACGVSHIEPALLAAKSDAVDHHPVPQKSPSGFLTFFGRLDAIEGNQLFRRCRKRMQQG
jgi:hypothetical protein